MTVERVGAPLTASERAALLELARRAVREAAARGRAREGDGGDDDDGDDDEDDGGHYRDRVGSGDDGGDPGEAPRGLDRPGAAFVTVRVAGKLRGCIGTFEPQASLWEAVHRMATAAATRDPRFDPIANGDLAGLGVEISVLSPPRRVNDPSEIEIGRHGLEVSLGFAHGLLLPQVAINHRLDREAFLGETCRKAGLPKDAWRNPGAEVRVFEAEVFGDVGNRAAGGGGQTAERAEEQATGDRRQATGQATGDRRQATGDARADADPLSAPLPAKRGEVAEPQARRERGALA